MVLETYGDSISFPYCIYIVNSHFCYILIRRITSKAWSTWQNIFLKSQFDSINTIVNSSRLISQTAWRQPYNSRHAKLHMFHLTWFNAFSRIICYSEIVLVNLRVVEIIIKCNFNYNVQFFAFEQHRLENLSIIEEKTLSIDWEFCSIIKHICVFVIIKNVTFIKVY